MKYFVASFILAFSSIFLGYNLVTFIHEDGIRQGSLQAAKYYNRNDYRLSKFMGCVRVNDVFDKRVKNKLK